jgi:hypothetical protein
VWGRGVCRCRGWRGGGEGCQEVCGVGLAVIEQNVMWGEEEAGARQQRMV